jgi:hypothetical protein
MAISAVIGAEEPLVLALVVVPVTPLTRSKSVSIRRIQLLTEDLIAKHRKFSFIDVSKLSESLEVAPSIFARGSGG